MSIKSNSALKMLSTPKDDRRITNYSLPYNSSSTIYTRNNFCSKTKTVCENNRHGILNSLNIYKVIVIGDVAAGKTCVIKRFCHKLFESNYKATIGVDFEVEKFEILGIPFNLQIWDTAGQERFKSIAQSYYRSSHVVIIVFDLTNVFSLTNCKTWLKEAKNASGNTDPFIFIVGTKKDLLSTASYNVVEKHAIKVCNELNGEYWPVSSKTGENINKLFFRVACLTFDVNISLYYVERKTENVFDEATNIVSFKKKKSTQKKENKCNGLKCSNN